MLSRLKEIVLVLVVAFGLFGAIMGMAWALQPEPPMEAALKEQPANTASAVPKASLSADAKLGAKLFALNCAHCHADDATGDEGPSLYDLTKSDARITKILKEGIKGEMPKFGTKFNDTDIQQLIAFLRTLKS